METGKSNFETHSYFPSGEWEGFYLQFGQKHKMECEIEFKENKITGHGSDEIGQFIWEGTYDLNNEKCTMIKSYIGAHKIFYDGDADENGIWGKWSISYLSDGFHLWPKKSKSENQSIEKGNHNKLN